MSEEYLGYTYDGSSDWTIGPASDPQGHPMISVHDRKDERAQKLVPMLAAAPEMLAMLARQHELLVEAGNMLTTRAHKLGDQRMFDDIQELLDAPYGECAALLRRARGES